MVAKAVGGKTVDIVDSAERHLRLVESDEFDHAVEVVDIVDSAERHLRRPR